MLAHCLKMIIGGLIFLALPIVILIGTIRVTFFRRRDYRRTWETTAGYVVFMIFAWGGSILSLFFIVFFISFNVRTFPISYQQNNERRHLEQSFTEEWVNSTKARIKSILPSTEKIDIIESVIIGKVAVIVQNRDRVLWSEELSARGALAFEPQEVRSVVFLTIISTDDVGGNLYWSPGYERIYDHYTYSAAFVVDLQSFQITGAKLFRTRWTDSSNNLWNAWEEKQAPKRALKMAQEWLGEVSIKN